MNTKGKVLLFAVVLVLVILGSGVWYFMTKPAEVANNQVATTTPAGEATTSPVVYKNTKFGFSVVLPQSWKGFTASTTVWEGLGNSATSGQFIVATGTEIIVRHPAWTESVPRQDIPIMVFTVPQWNDMKNDKFHIGAGPVEPLELGRNNRFVFALPARYNFAFMEGFEEVESIIESKPLRVE